MASLNGVRNSVAHPCLPDTILLAIGGWQSNLAKCIEAKTKLFGTSTCLSWHSGLQQLYILPWWQKQHGIFQLCEQV